MLARFQRIVELIESLGLEYVHESHIKHLKDKLWEMRLKRRDGISRAIHVTASGKRLIELRVSIKKTQKTPRKELTLALKRSERDRPMKSKRACDLHDDMMQNDAERCRTMQSMHVITLH